MIIFRRLDDDCMKSCRIFAAELGKMPEWSIGPHSKCGERATVPRVRIPVSPLNVSDKTGQRTDKSHKFNDLWDFFYPLMSALKYTISPLKDKVRNLTRTPDN